MRDNLSHTGAFPALLPAPQPLPDSPWRFLTYFNYYRLILGVLLLAIALFFGEAMSNSAREYSLFATTTLLYFLLVMASIVLVQSQQRRLNLSLQLAFQMSTDIVLVSLLAYFGGSTQSNLGMLLLVSLAFGAMVSRGRITWFYAALASIAMLLEHALAVLTRDASFASFFQVGMLSASYFAISALSQTLTRYAKANEKLAMMRGVDLSNMAEANRLMIQDMPDGVLVVDERGGVRQFNPGAERLLGYTFPVGGQVNLAQCSPLIEALFAGWRQNKALGNEVLRLPITHLMVRVRFLPVERDGFWGAIVVLEDMQRAQEQAQQVKLAALGRLTANIAHEVRNPLSSISYATELLREGSQDAAQERLLNIILDNTSRLNRIVQDVMQVNRRDRLNAEEIDLCVRLPLFIDELCQAEKMPREVFALNILANCQARFDRGHFEQVLWNLCRNALRYSQRQAASVQLNVFQSDDGKLCLEVEDDGVGVRADALQKLFEPFSTTDASGTGLGLYIARELCEANGARIEYRHVDMGGACFRITFGLRQ
jgi:two-component system sensor histidine kinase PilS (NtrC family)